MNPISVWKKTFKDWKLAVPLQKCPRKLNMNQLRVT